MLVCIFKVLYISGAQYTVHIVPADVSLVVVVDQAEGLQVWHRNSTDQAHAGTEITPNITTHLFQLVGVDVVRVQRGSEELNKADAVVAVLVDALEQVVGLHASEVWVHELHGREKLVPFCSALHMVPESDSDYTSAKIPTVPA
jgi:hypothetical protein